MLASGDNMSDSCERLGQADSRFSGNALSCSECRLKQLISQQLFPSPLEERNRKLLRVSENPLKRSVQALRTRLIALSATFASATASAAGGRSRLWLLGFARDCV